MLTHTYKQNDGDMSKGHVSQLKDIAIIKVEKFEQDNLFLLFNLSYLFNLIYFIIKYVIITHIKYICMHLHYTNVIK